MSPTITLSNIGWSTPDGTPILDDVSLAIGRGRTGIVGRNGSGKSTLLGLIDGSLTPTVGALSLEGRVAVLRQEMGAQAGQRIQDLFHASAALAALKRAEQGRASTQDLALADWTLPNRIEASLLKMGLNVALATPLENLSGGQQVRAGLAAVVFRDPDFILLDEPTNNLDRAGRAAVMDLVTQWPRGLLLVSHDRELLEAMDVIIELSEGTAALYGGNYSAYQHQKALAAAAIARRYADAQKAQQVARKRAQQVTERKARKDSRGKKSRAKGGQPKSLLDFNKARAEASAGAHRRLRDARQQERDAAVTTARAKVEVTEPIEMDMPSCALPSNKTVVQLRNVSGGYVPSSPVIRNVDLTIVGPQRIALKGHNGVGKSTLLKLVAGVLAPDAGSIDRMGPVAYLDQSVSMLTDQQSLIENFVRLNPQARRHDAHAVLSRFRFRADEAEKLAGQLSGGERLRSGLACAMGRAPTPQLLLLDEPTNHLDIAGLTALEMALNNYDGAMIIVSHDTRFLENIRIDHIISL